MTEQKMTQDEIYQMFGGTIPIAAANFLFDANNGEISIAVARERLRGMGELWKALQKTLIRPANKHPFTFGGRVVGIENEPLCIMETDKLAEQMAMFLNLGHEEFLKLQQEAQS